MVPPPLFSPTFRFLGHRQTPVTSLAPDNLTLARNMSQIVACMNPASGLWVFCHTARKPQDLCFLIAFCLPRTRLAWNPRTHHCALKLVFYRLRARPGICQRNKLGFSGSRPLWALRPDAKKKQKKQKTLVFLPVLAFRGMCHRR